MAKTPYEGRLRDAVNGAHGMRPFAYEISIATHLMQKGWDVEFVDYSGVARFDFLARQDTVEVEIECKTTSNDTGRKIHRQEVNRLADLLLPVREQLAERQGCHRILVTVPDRLSKSNDVLHAIASSVSAAVNTGGRYQPRRCKRVTLSNPSRRGPSRTVNPKPRSRSLSGALAAKMHICSFTDARAFPSWRLWSQRKSPTACRYDCRTGQGGRRAV